MKNDEDVKKYGTYSNMARLEEELVLTGEPKHYGMALAPGKFIIRFQPEPEQQEVDFSKFV